MLFMQVIALLFMNLTEAQVHMEKSKMLLLTEDIPYLFVPFCELAKICGVQVPAAEALITLANLYNDVDYRKTGRTLEKIGFNHWTKQEILEFLQV